MQQFGIILVLLLQLANCISQLAEDECAEEGGGSLNFEVQELPLISLAQKQLAKHFTATLINQNAYLYSVMFASALWLPELDAHFVVCRIYLAYEASYLCSLLFDKAWQPIKKSHSINCVSMPGIIDIPNKSKGKPSSGPEDARAFLHADDIYLIFNMLDSDGVRKMWLYAVKANKLHAIYHGKTLQGKEMTLCVPMIEKNWCPLPVGGRLFFVYNYRNFQLIEYNPLSPICPWIQGDYATVPGALRGGSPFVRLGSSDYYFSIAYTHTPKKNIYRPALTIVKADSKALAFTLVYTGKVLALEACIKQFSGSKEARRIITAPSIIAQDDKSVSITVSCQDRENYIVKIGGLPDRIAAIIASYEQDFLPGNQEGEAERWAAKHCLAFNEK